MAGNILGVSVGINRTAFALLAADGRVLKLAVEPTPRNIVKNGEILAFDSYATFIRDSIKKNDIGARDCAMVLPTDVAFMRRIALPLMTMDELAVNLPYEFRDYIGEEKDDYVFDYSLVGMRDSSEGGSQEMDLFAVAASKKTLEDAKGVMRKAGTKLVTLAPAPCAFTNLIRAYEMRDPTAVGTDYCFVDIGYSNTKIHLFTGGSYEVSRTVNMGTSLLVAAVVDRYGVDEQIAQAYLDQDFEGVLRSDECRRIYESYATEVARVISYFNYTYPDSNLSSLSLCGSGGYYAPLWNSVREQTGLIPTNIESIMPPIPDEYRLLAMHCSTPVGIALHVGEVA